MLYLTHDVEFSGHFPQAFPKLIEDNLPEVEEFARVSDTRVSHLHDILKKS
jgi:hypothetical protein